MTGKKIVISANTSWYLYNFRKNTILALIKEGHKVYCVCPTDNYSERLNSLGSTHHNVSIDSGGTNPFKDLVTLLQLIRIFVRLKPDVIFNFTPKNNVYGAFAGRLVKAKVVNNIAGLGAVFIEKTLTSKIAQLLYKSSQVFVSKIFFQNEDDKKLFADSGIASNVEKERIPGSGVDLERFKPINRTNDGKVKFILIARMLKEKGVELYVNAARKMKTQFGDNVEFNLLGFLDVDNPGAILKQQMDKWVEEGVVKYLGVSDAVEEVMSKMDCVVLPSYYREGVPKSLLEAGALGKPIITTDSIGCKETVDAGVNGYLCKPRSESSLLNCMELFFNLPLTEREKMGEASRFKMEKQFSEKIIIQKYIKCISE